MKAIVIAAMLITTPAYADCAYTVRSWIDVIRDLRYNGADTIDLKMMILDIKERERRGHMNRIAVLTEMYPASADDSIVALEKTYCDFWDEMPSAK